MKNFLSGGGRACHQADLGRKPVQVVAVQDEPLQRRQQQHLVEGGTVYSTLTGFSSSIVKVLQVP